MKASLYNIVRISASQVGKLKDNPDDGFQMRELLNTARELFKDREKILTKEKSRYFYSPALEQIQNYYKKHPMKDYNNMGSSSQIRAQEMAEFFRIQEFFRSKSSTVKGARELMREQDIRIFGINENTGRPNHKMSKAQRDTYWEFYHEFNKLYKNAKTAYTSGTIQQYLGEMQVRTRGRGKDLSFDSFEDFKQYMDKRIAEKKAGADDANKPNIYSGNWANK